MREKRSKSSSSAPKRARKCRHCLEGALPPDYKDVDGLARLMTGQGKMFSRKRTGFCARCQRLFARAVKQARFLALLSHTGRY